MKTVINDTKDVHLFAAASLFDDKQLNGVVYENYQIELESCHVAIFWELEVVNRGFYGRTDAAFVELAVNVTFVNVGLEISIENGDDDDVVHEMEFSVHSHDPNNNNNGWELKTNFDNVPDFNGTLQLSPDDIEIDAEEKTIEIRF